MDKKLSDRVAIATGGSAGIGRAIALAFAQERPIGRYAEPEEIAESVLWLCSDASSFIAGQSIPVDGGWTAQ